MDQLENVSLTLAEMLYVVEALKRFRAVLDRGRQKEVPGSAVRSLRGQEMASIDSLIDKFRR